ncbi:MAG: hypothetical protein ACOYB2_15165 [Limnohabitans sp.]
MNSNFQIAPSGQADDVQFAALQDAIAQTQVMLDAWWRVNDAVRLLHAQNADAPECSKVLAQVQAIDRPIRHLQASLMDMAAHAADERDGLAVAAITTTPESEALVRERLKQADLHLSALYKKLQRFCHQAASPLVDEMSGDAAQDLPPLWDAQVEAKLDYLLDESNPLFDEESNNILASQEAVSWHIRPEGNIFHVMDDDPAVDNWLDYSHRWMQRQGWLTHDVLEHNHGHHPRFGVAALLQTGTVWVEVHTVRSYAFDFHAGKFLSPADN